MKTEVTRDEIDLDSCIRNVSVQTGEEFSPQFLQNLTQRRKLHVNGESSQEYQEDSITLERTIQTGNACPQELHKDLAISKKTVHTYKEFPVDHISDNDIPTGIVTDQCQQARVGIQFNQNEKLVYECHIGSRISEKDPIQSMYTNEIYNVQATLYKPEPKIKFLCSFGGKILARPSDGKLRYVGGETRIISIRKKHNFQELMKKTYSICKQHHIIKYQLPGEDLDALISVCSDEDFHYMIDEYNELEKGSQRLRIVLESLNEREKPCSCDSAYKYVVAVNGIPEPSPQKRSSRESPTVSPTDSITSLQQDSPNLTRKIPNQNNMQTSCMQSPSFYKDATNFRPRVGKDRVDQPAYENTYHLDVTNVASGTYLNRRFVESHDERSVCENTYSVLHLYGQGNVDFKKPVIKQDPNVISGTIVPSANLSKLEDSASFVHMTKEKTETSEWDQDTIKWMEKNNLNLGFILDTEECQHIVSPATPLERQLSIATTVSSDTGLPNNISIETSRPDVNPENPFLIADFNETEHLIHDLVVPNSTIFAPISSDVSLGVTTEDISDILPPNILSSMTDFLYIRGKNESVGQSDSKDVEDHKNIRDEPISDATMAEIQAGRHGLQTIKNADLEELRELGCGTFGTVYHGKWRGTDVAIKRIRESCFAGKASEQDRLTKDFWREAQILSQLHHPNVVALYGVVRDGPKGTLSTVTEYMANGSLRRVLSKSNRALDRRKKLIIAQDAAIGMEYLHLKNIVHFDLKCDNLLVNLGDPERPVCKVGDFGLSRIKCNSLVSGGARGTLPWIAPELLDGSSTQVSEKVDVFSFGIAMWEILTGEEPYADMHCGAIIGGIVTNTLRPPVPRNCDGGWKALMEECWSNDPTDRPSFTRIAKQLQAMSDSKTQKRAIRQEYNHNQNHLYKPSIL